MDNLNFYDTSDFAEENEKVISAGFNFTKVLRAAFTRADPKSAKKAA